MENQIELTVDHKNTTVTIPTTSDKMLPAYLYYVLGYIGASGKYRLKFLDAEYANLQEFQDKRSTKCE